MQWLSLNCNALLNASLGTRATGNNDAGQIVGVYWDAQGLRPRDDGPALPLASRDRLITLVGDNLSASPLKAMENQGAQFPAPTSANVTVMRKRPREYLTEAEIERLMAAARKNRHGRRDATAIRWLIAMPCGPASLSACAGTTWTSQ
jgi:hypothetical protein